jgi:hypothetical protein
MTRLYSQKGAVILVALCFVVVLGISLASYISMSSRAMQLSHRTFQAGLSKQLAEMGQEEALRALNRNDWSDWTNGTAVDWTLDAANKRATATITFPAGKFGQGLTGSVKIRVDNYDAYQLDSAWVTGTSYRVNDLVGDNGIWYRCIKAHTSGASNQPVNWNYWVPEGVPWTWDSSRTYAAEDLIVYNEVWYRCISSNTNHAPPSYPAEWQALVAIYTSVPAWPYTTGGQEALLLTGGGVVRLTNANWGTNPPYQWRWRDGQSYKLNDVVLYNGVWYRSGSDHTSSWSNYPTGWATVWTTMTSMWDWSNFTSYNLNDVVYHTGSNSWYRCIRAHSSAQTPSSSPLYWSNKPRFEMKWDSGRQYGANDTVFYNGLWYLSLQGSNYGQNPATATTYWASAANPSYQWDSSTSYAANTYRSYSGAWYKSLSAHTGQSPNNSTYWTSAWAQSAGVTSGAPVIYTEGTIRQAGNPATVTQLRAIVAPAPLFPNALGASTLINLPSTATIDSYDATYTYNSTTAPFSAASPNRGSSAVVAGGTTSATAVTMTSARVNGYVSAPPASTAPYAPRWTYGGTAIVTDVASPTVPPTRVDLARVSRSPFIPQFAIQAVAGGINITLPSGTITRLGTPGATTPSIYTISGNLDRISSSSDILYIVGPVVLNVTGRLYMTNSPASGRIVISPTGSLRLRFAGQLWVGGGSPVATIQNLTLDPQKCILLGTSTGNTAGSHYYWSTDPFYGVIYMPNAYLSTWSNVPLYGAVSASNIAFPQAGGQMHYDTNLRHATIPGVEQPYAITEWRELTDASELATMP